MEYFKTIDFPIGFNFSFIQSTIDENKFIGSIRVVTSIPGRTYPECISDTYILEFDKEFNIISSYKLDQELEGIPKYKAYSAGFEDCRLISDNSFFCTSLDTNPYWKPEMLYVEFSATEKQVTVIKKLYFENQEPQVEKNWVILKKNNNIFECLYWCNPLQIISVDINTGITKIIKEYNIPNIIERNRHGGCSIWLETEKKYLIIVRNFNKDNKYAYESSSWILLDEKYDFCGISEPFTFLEIITYDLCLSLHLDNNILYAALTFGEKTMCIYKCHLNKILDKILDNINDVNIL